MKIVFIINSISAQRCIKRVEEFIANGYEVDVYGFSRKMAVPLEPKNFRLNVIGTFENAMPFAKRLNSLTILSKLSDSPSMLLKTTKK